MVGYLSECEGGVKYPEMNENRWEERGGGRKQ